MTLEQILEIFPEEELLKADGFDDAIIGVEQTQLRLVYDIDKMRNILIEQEGMSFEEAMEYLDFNVFEALVDDAIKALGLKLAANERKQILNAVSWRDPRAAKVIKKRHQLTAAKLKDLLSLSSSASRTGNKGGPHSL